MLEGINYNEQRREIKAKIDEILGNIRKSNHGLLKMIGLELIPVATGAAFGGIGRATGYHWIPAVPYAMDFRDNFEGHLTARGLLGMAKYGLGVSLAYADKIYPILIEKAPEIMQKLQEGL